MPSSSPLDAATTSVIIPYRANLLGNIEQALKGLLGYGIMALELIQNADDAGAASLSFDVRDEALVVSNDRSFTSCGLQDAECPWIKKGDPTNGLKRPCNFHAISEMGSRSKLHDSEQIGRFGIGFVSVYQITDTPIIRSADVELRLNPQTQEVVKSEVVQADGTKFILPWAATESEVRSGLNASPTPADIVDKVVAEVGNVLESSLLFLRHVERVELRRNGAVVTVLEIVRTGEEVKLKFKPSGITRRWLVLSREADDIVNSDKISEKLKVMSRLDRSRTVNVAIPLDIEQFDGLLYAYLPTRQTTGMPVHVNADFFPHASRQAIVLEGESHERIWNQALIETAAEVLGDNLTRIRDLLGPNRFWALMEAAFQRKADLTFKFFWDKLSKAALDVPLVWTTQSEWRLPKNTALPPEAMTAVDQDALADLGIPLIHPTIRRYWTVLSSLGAQRLGLSDLVTALEDKGDDATVGGGESLRRLWSATAQLIEYSIDKPLTPAVLKRLKAVPFLLDAKGQPINPNDARKLPANVSEVALSEFVPDRRLVHSHVLLLPQIGALVREYRLKDLATDLAGKITDHASASSTIGETDAEARHFYGLLTSFTTDDRAADVSGILSNVPMLRTGAGFVSPARGQLPGDFKDPIGHFEIVDTRLFCPGMMEFAQHVLQVDVLTFHQYIEDHLEDILASGLSREQYGILLSEIVDHRFQLDENGTNGALAKTAFVRTRAGEFVRPAKVYYWSADLEAILGKDPSRWVDESWLPRGHPGRLRDLFDRLEMPTTVSTAHLVERIAEIAETSSLDEIVKETTLIIRHITERWNRFDDDDVEVLKGLKHVSFLSAVVDGKRHEDTRYSPTQVYRAVRAAAFASQVPIVEMPPLRQSTTVISAFLDIIEMPSEPPTDKVVAHVEHCIETNEEVHDLTYQMLSERLERSDNEGCIDRLKETNFIYVPGFGFIGGGEVFWSPPPFGTYWHSASQRMHLRQNLYRRLGVTDAPEPKHFSSLAMHIAQNAPLSGNDIVIHSRCLAALAEALEAEGPSAAESVDSLLGKQAFVSVSGKACWTEEAIWLDSEQLANPFGADLDDRLIRLTDVSRSAAIRFFHRLDVLALSDLARFRLAEEPDGVAAEEPTSRLQSRADLILWLAPNRAARQALRESLAGLDIRFSSQLLVQAEIDAFDPPVRTPASAANSYLDHEAGLLHIRSEIGRMDWIAAFRALFAAVERHCPTADVPPLCATAAFIMSLEDRADAEQALRESGFKAPSDEESEIEVGRMLRDEESDAHAEAYDETEVIEGGPSGQDIPGDTEKDVTTGSHVAFNFSGASDTKIGAGVDHKGASEGFNGTGADHSINRGAGTFEDNEDDVGLDDESYGSLTGRGAFGKESSADAVSDVSVGAEAEPVNATSSPRSRGGGNFHGSRDDQKAGAIAERQIRRTRMLTYVARGELRDEDSTGSKASASDDITDLIDAAAMKAALSYEQTRGWDAERQPHFNPGFDIASKSSEGSRRLIEVKGLENEWNERGVKLSHVQFSMAREHPDEFWIYVVEHARDIDRQRVYAISNPFSKVKEYWFDHNWHDASEERVSSRDIHLQVGLKVKHQMWGNGVVEEIKSRGLIPFVVVDFGKIEGRRGIPFNTSLRIID